MGQCVTGVGEVFVLVDETYSTLIPEHTYSKGSASNL